MPGRKQIIESLFESFHTIKRKLIEEHIASKSNDISPSQGLVLRTIFKKKEMGVKEIADDLKITSSAATQLINGLVEKGYLNRVQAKDDRRAIKISFSEKAKKRIGQIREKSYDQLSILFSVLSNEELEQYSRLNQKIAESIVNK